jgi:hypothetical protein
MKKKGTDLKDLTVVELNDKLQERAHIADHAALQPHGKPDRKPGAAARPSARTWPVSSPRLRKRELANTDQANEHRHRDHR